MKMFPTSLALALAFGAAVVNAAPASVSAFQQMPDDTQAIVVRATGDGRADDTAAIQDAINRAANKGEGGLVFLPSGRYRLTRSLLIPLAVRVYGASTNTGRVLPTP
jgi:polygalacturonase